MSVEAKRIKGTDCSAGFPFRAKHWGGGSVGGHEGTQLVLGTPGSNPQDLGMQASGLPAKGITARGECRPELGTLLRDK